MKNLKLTSFKAFETEVAIDLVEEKNLLVYGENGAGKSSIYQAIKLCFFKSHLIKHITASTPEDEVQLLKQFWETYNNKISNNDFSIEIDGIGYDSFDPASHQVFMISLDELTSGNDEINLRKLLQKFCLNIGDPEVLIRERFNQIQDSVNSGLTAFRENISIVIDEQDGYNVKLIDEPKKIERKQELKKYFNEAKLNIIVLLLLLSVIEISKDAGKRKLLVLDDFITSLDVSNRTFLIRYIFEKFSDTQLIILTHNISFHNLMMYMVNEELFCKKTRWLYANVYEIGNRHKIYIKSEIENAQTLHDSFRQLPTTNNDHQIEELGNRVRKKFEVLIHEFSKFTMLGAVEDSKKILDRITKGSPVYYKKGNKDIEEEKDKNLTASDLVAKIESILAENPVDLSKRLQDEIDGYKKADFDKFKMLLKELKLYQKVTMHPMSHGMFGNSVFTYKELERSIELILKMEKLFKNIVGGNVTQA